MLLLEFELSIVFFTLIQYTTQQYVSQPPLWLTSPYLRAGNQDVITNFTDGSAPTSFTFTFTTSLNDIPYLGFGMKNYVAEDFLGNQKFQIIKTSLTTSTFTLEVTLYSTTYVWHFNVAYIAIEKTFPHHLNSFDDFPVNYAAGSLTNITQKSTTQILTYKNTINYTKQANGRTYKTFSNPLQNNKIILFISNIYIYSTTQHSLPWYPIDFIVESEVLSSQYYSLTVRLSNNTRINRLKFSQIIFNQQNLNSTDQYQIISGKIDIPQSGQFIIMPSQLIQNFILGLVDFSTIRGRAVLDFNWDFATEDGVHGVRVKQSVPIYAGYLGLERMGAMIFYIKTWRCQTGYQYFNHTSDECQDMCGDYHYENTTQYICQQCSNFCQDCTSPYDCIKCNPDDNRILVSDSCLCMEDYYQVDELRVCQHCSVQVSNCLDCFYNSSYNSTTAGFGEFQFGCQNCSDGYFLAGVQCLACSSNCKQCINSSTCIQCIDGYFLDGFQCSVCQSYCKQCTNSSICVQCFTETYRIIIDASCQLDVSLLTMIQGVILIDYISQKIDFIITINPQTDAFNQVISQRVHNLVSQNIQVLDTYYNESKVYVSSSFS